MYVRRVALLLVLAGWLCLPTAGRAEDAQPPLAPTTLQAIKARGFLRCGGVERPGIATVDGTGRWSGLAVEICRAVSVAVFGPAAQVDFHNYDSARDFDAPRSGEDDVAFLTFAEMAGQNLADKLLPGPPVFIESVDMMVAEPSSFRHPGDLEGQGICFMIATVGELALEAWAHDHKLEFVPRAFQEDGELFDTYNVQRCKAVVGESTYLASRRRDGGINTLKSRLLTEHLDRFPIVAATSLRADTAWAAIVAWTIDTLINADARESDYHANGVAAMSLDATALGLARGWQTAVTASVGSYSRIFARNLGAESPLRLEQGLNRRLADGGALVVPVR